MHHNARDTDDTSGEHRLSEQCIDFVTFTDRFKEVGALEKEKETPPAGNR